jgi:hypothetical protein
MCSDRVVAVTGGARGIGRAIAARRVADGAAVAIGDIDTAASPRGGHQGGRDAGRLQQARPAPDR